MVMLSQICTRDLWPSPRPYLWWYTLQELKDTVDAALWKPKHILLELTKVFASSVHAALIFEKLLAWFLKKLLAF